MPGTSHGDHSWFTFSGRKTAYPSLCIERGNHFYGLPTLRVHKEISRSLTCSHTPLIPIRDNVSVIALALDFATLNITSAVRVVAKASSIINKLLAAP